MCVKGALILEVRKISSAEPQPAATKVLNIILSETAHQLRVYTSNVHLVVELFLPSRYSQHGQMALSSYFGTMDDG